MFHEGIDFVAQSSEAVLAREPAQHLGGDEMRHDPVDLPETDEPEEASVRVAIEAGAGKVRTGNREPEFSDLAHPGGLVFGKG
jgi:hypothetical protein